MCPPGSIPPAVELDEYSTDEIIIKSLMQLKSGHIVPSNVLADVDPCQSTPSNLPAGIWYFLCGSKMDTKDGFWRSTGEACEIYKNSLIVGLRRTLHFYEGPAHDGQKTNWRMQEYTTTEKYTSKQDPRALYKVFLVDDSSGGGGHLSKSGLVKTIGDVAGPSGADYVSMDDFLELDDLTNQSDQFLGDSVLRGDFLELDDLATPLSRTTSSADSSCMTMSMTSEELFDQEIQDSRIKLNLSVPAKLKQVIMQPTTLGSVANVKESKSCPGETSKTVPTLEDENTSKQISPSSSSSPPTSSSSNSSDGSSKEEKKDRANRTKKRKMMKYLCFLAF